MWEGGEEQELYPYVAKQRKKFKFRLILFLVFLNFFSECEDNVLFLMNIIIIYQKEILSIAISGNLIYCPFNYLWEAINVYFYFSSFFYRFMSVLAGHVRVADKEENYIITNSFIGVIEPPFTLGI